MRAWLGAPVDAAGLVAFRMAFGLLVTWSAARFVAYGWVQDLYLAPSFHFPWVPWAVVPPAPVLYALFAIMAAAGLAIAAGWHLRATTGAFLVAFVYVELLDKTLYLNHYVLLTWLAGWLWLIAPQGDTVPRWAILAVRAQVGIVYLFAGLCKLHPDWLVLGEPLHTWLRARAAMPVLGPLLTHPGTALVMAWGGALYDLFIPFALLGSRTRTVAFGFVLIFHLLTWWLFPIGVFPWLMIAASTVFFDPSWPRRFTGRPAHVAPRGTPLSRPALAALLTVALLQVALPLRHLALPGQVNWHEQGFRFAWRVLLIEKTGMVEFRVVDRATGHTALVDPTAALTPLQDKMMATQPDLIAQFARHLAHTAAAEGRDVAVFADAYASLNGRPTQRLIDPTVDLTLPWWRRQQAGWVVPLASR